jgi:hypothetical protein
MFAAQITVCKTFLIKFIGTFTQDLKLEGMNTTGKIAIGVSLASSFLLAAWLLTGDRKVKTRDFVSKKTEGIRDALKTVRPYNSELDAYYI